jgi:hypothetical protein
LRFYAKPLKERGQFKTKGGGRLWAPAAFCRTMAASFLSKPEQDDVLVLRLAAFRFAKNYFRLSPQ